MNDQEAIEHLKEGRIGGLEVLVTRYQSKAIRTAFLITHDPMQAEDVVQDTFIRIYQKIRHFDPERSFEPYLMRSVVNAALNSLRKDKRSVPMDGDLAAVEYLLSRSPSTESQVEQRQLSEQIMEALGSLSPRQRAVIVQRYYLGMSEKEMAETADVARGTVKWLLHAARKRLEKILQPERSTK